MRTPELERAIHACIETFDSVTSEMQHIRLHSGDAHTIHGAEYEDFMINIRGIIAHGRAPSEYFNHLGDGSFKECYDSGIDGWIIKFATNENNSATEEQILNLAIEREIGDLFLPTFFISLPQALDVTHVTDDNAGEYYTHRTLNTAGESRYTYHRYDGYESDLYLDTAIIQPRVTVANEIGYEVIKYIREEYDLNPLRTPDDDPIPYDDFCDMGITNRDWLQAALNIYGQETFYRLKKFISEFCINDLESRNLGWFNGKPVILDWLSRDPD